MKNFQQELDKESELKELVIEFFNHYNLNELYLIKEVLENEIKLSETAKSEGFE